METKKSVVSSFDVDHLTLKEGLYLRSVYTINDDLAVHSWDMRFRAPMDHSPLGSGEVHTIEHLWPTTCASIPSSARASFRSARWAARRASTSLR
ncbi:MAG: S-ribosylhomocysteine lyase [Alistipes sp.]|nr:S-ribosylhomocysteine lyase [Alistipes sp.]